MKKPETKTPPVTPVKTTTPEIASGRALAAPRNDDEVEGVVSEGVVWARVKKGFVPVLVRIHGRTVVEEEALVKEPATWEVAKEAMMLALVRRVIPAKVGGK